MIRKLGIIVVCFVLLQLSVVFSPIQAAVFSKKVEENKQVVAPDVTHISEKYQSDDLHGVVNVLDVNLNNPFTKMELGLPNPLGSLKKTTSLTREYSYEGHHVVGAVNAAFFLGNGSPANLLAQNNRIMNYGILGKSYDSPTQQPVAFGITQSGKAIADYYRTELSFTVLGETFPIHSINSDRGEGETTLYTEEKATTETNTWGVEIIVENASKSTKELSFGDTIIGTVNRVTSYGVEGNSPIPENGFVLSVHSPELRDKMSGLPIGTPVQIDLNIEEKWKDAQFILAAGPLLVKDGKPSLSMPADSSFAKTRSDRTAVAVDATGTRVFLVTVDGRQAGYSNGTSLHDLASLLISKGAHAAINLDGGGSTTMAVRKPYTVYPTLANRPSGGSERSVSAILQVVNIAPPGKVTRFELAGVPTMMMKDDSINLSTAQAFDEYMNPATIDVNQIQWSVEGDIGGIEGSTFKATKEGKGKVVGVYAGIRAEKEITVLDLGKEPYLLDSFDEVSNWKAETARATASVAKGSSSEPARQGEASLKLSYDFTTGEAGTKAAYAVAKNSLSIPGHPLEIGVWAYGDGNQHWLRGVLIDGSGQSHTISFTAENGFNWKGWKYATANVPADIPQPLKLERLYIAQPTANLQKKGKVYFDQLQAVYVEGYKEKIYRDVEEDYWAYPHIGNLNMNGLINGYPDGSFKPKNSITRAEAAAIIARALNLKKTKDPNFNDVNKNHFAYNDIAAVAEKGIITGRKVGSFAPEGKLTRAEMATILRRAYTFNGKATISFKDLNENHWAFESIQVLVANELIAGYPDNTFGPDKQITRAEFAKMLDIAMKR